MAALTITTVTADVAAVLGFISFIFSVFSEVASPQPRPHTNVVAVAQCQGFDHDYSGDRNAPGSQHQAGLINGGGGGCREKVPAVF